MTNGTTTTYTADATHTNINVAGLDTALIAGNVIIDPGDPTGTTQVLTPVAATGSGALTFGTATNINGIALGADVSSGGAQTYNGPLTLASDAAVTTSGGNVTFESAVDGAHGLTVNAAGGTTAFNGAVGGNQALASISIDGTGGIALNGGSVTTTGDQVYSGAVTVGAPTTLSAPGISAQSSVALGPNALTIAGGSTLAGVVSGTGGGSSLTKTGSGTLALLAHNTYAGGTSIDGGAVSFASAGIPIPGGGLTIDGGTLQWGSSNNDDVSPLAIGSGGATLDTNGRDVTLGSVVSDRPGPPGALTKVGDGTLRLDANNTYSGGTTVTRGLISFSSPGDLGSGNITLNRGGLQWASGNVDVSPRLNPIGSGGATFDTVNSDVAFAKPLTGSGSVTKQGTGTLALGGANTYSGMTEIANGAIDVPRGSSVAGPVLVGSGSALSVGGHDLRSGHACVWRQRRL